MMITLVGLFLIIAGSANENLIMVLGGGILLFLLVVDDYVERKYPKESKEEED
jgi:hypothetical protein